VINQSKPIPLRRQQLDFTRQRLVDAARELFRRNGTKGTSIDDIAKAAGTAKGNFYRYFVDKNELVESILEPVAFSMRDAMDRCEQSLERAHDDASLFAAYQALAMELIPLIDSEREAVRLYLQESRAPAAGARAPIRELADEIRDRAIDLTEFAVDHGLLRVRDPRISALAVVGAVEQLAFMVLGGHLDAPPDAIAGTLIGLVLRGIRG